VIAMMKNEFSEVKEKARCPQVKTDNYHWHGACIE